MQLGPYLHPRTKREDVWRMASEDSGMRFDQPSWPASQSFLLIFCTGRIVTDARNTKKLTRD